MKFAFELNPWIALVAVYGLGFLTTCYIAGRSGFTKVLICGLVDSGTTAVVTFFAALLWPVAALAAFFVWIYRCGEKHRRNPGPGDW